MNTVVFAGSLEIMSLALPERYAEHFHFSQTVRDFGNTQREFLKWQDEQYQKEKGQKRKRDLLKEEQSQWWRLSWWPGFWAT